ncbi:hypothetical protein P692DRAFT_201806930 [Suillus brevipes Sb2]|nr:hypothetical protein P692DRAFT_201806930 [Suillus brevipes Sb2]
MTWQKVLTRSGLKRTVFPSLITSALDDQSSLHSVTPITSRLTVTKKHKKSVHFTTHPLREVKTLSETYVEGYTRSDSTTNTISRDQRRGEVRKEMQAFVEKLYTRPPSYSSGACYDPPTIRIFIPRTFHRRTKFLTTTKSGALHFTMESLSLSKRLNEQRWVPSHAELFFGQEEAGDA